MGNWPGSLEEFQNGRASESSLKTNSVCLEKWKNMDYVSFAKQLLHLRIMHIKKKENTYMKIHTSI